MLLISRLNVCCAGRNVRPQGRKCLQTHNIARSLWPALEPYGPANSKHLRLYSVMDNTDMSHVLHPPCECQLDLMVALAALELSTGVLTATLPLAQSWEMVDRCYAELRAVHVKVKAAMSQYLEHLREDCPDGIAGDSSSVAAQDVN
jgi:hypothetical protein